MQSEEVVREFFLAYQRHDYRRMYDLLSPGVQFHDMAFDISGGDVFAMWQWFCRKTPERGPVEVVSFRIVETRDDTVVAEYHIKYDFPLLKPLFIQPISYTIPTRFMIKNGKIVEQFDSGSFDVWSRQAFGPLVALVNWSKFFQGRVKDKAVQKLYKFMKSGDFIKPD